MKRKIGLLLIVLGTLILALTRIPALASSNTLLAAGLMMILSGIVAYIRGIKSESAY